MTRFKTFILMAIAACFGLLIRRRDRVDEIALDLSAGEPPQTDDEFTIESGPPPSQRTGGGSRLA